MITKNKSDILNLPEIQSNVSPPESESSYGQILKASSVIGGAQGLNYLMGMVRTKAIAILLGPSGVGIIGLYQNAMSMLSTLAGLGISNSGVRQIAEAHGSGDDRVIGITIKVIRRVCWITGIAGWLLTVLLSYPLSLWVFGSTSRAIGLAVLGGTLLMGTISGGQTALIQGFRRIADLARINVFSMVANTIAGVAIYCVLREKGIVPVLFLTAAVNLGFSWWFARGIKAPEVDLPLNKTWGEAKKLVGFGLAVMWSALLGSAAGLLIRTAIVREVGMEANGIYQAAWGLSGLFAGFILNAMGTDFYPRLTAAAKDHGIMNRLVNEQVEIGLLLSLPGLLGTLAFAPFVMRVFYSAKFASGAPLLPWFIVGVFLRVIGWPLGYILLAKGYGKLFALVETVFIVINLLLVFWFLRLFGLPGTAYAFVVLYLLAVPFLMLLSSRLTGFSVSRSLLRLSCISVLIIALGFSCQKFLPHPYDYVVGGILTVWGFVISLRGLVSRLGQSNKLVQMAFRIPGLRGLCAGFRAIP
jgi:antigen flippase